MPADHPADPADPDPAQPDSVGSRSGATTPPAVAMTERLRRDLTQAMRDRDAVRVRTLRVLVGAIANAEAPAVAAPPSAADEPVVGVLVEHARLELGADDVEAILRHEVADRQDTIDQYVAHGREDEAADLRAEQAVIERYL